MRRLDTQWKHFSKYLFEVVDTGWGIPEKDLDRIFSPFNQVHHVNNRKADGSGLGLSIAKKLTEALEGTIGVTSHLGQGSTFWVELPLQPLAPGTFYPPLNLLPSSTESLSEGLKYFGGSVEATNLLLTSSLNPSLEVGTNCTGTALDTLTHYLSAWKVTLKAISTDAELEEFLEKGGSRFILDDGAVYLSDLFSRARSSTRPLRSIVFS